MAVHVGAMANFFWANTYRSAASAMLVMLGGLALLDLLTRPAFDTAETTSAANLMAILAIVLAILGGICLVIPFERWRDPARLLPPAIATGALLIAIVGGNIADAPAAPIGLVLATFAILIYLGLALPPGVALALAPVLLIVLLVAQRRDPDSISLALPLLAVPVASMVAELIASLTSRSERANDRGDRRLAQLARLEEVLRGFRRPGSLHQAAHQVAVAAREIFEVERSTVVLRDSRGELIPVTIGPASRRDPDPAIAQIVAETIGGDEPRLVPTGTNGTILVLPLPALEAPAGAVLVYPAPTDDPEFTLDLARLFGVQVGIAIEHLFVIDELARATTRDELTGIGNRRHADALVRSLQPGDALILLDLDGFKAVNDTYGHSAGDLVLQELSAHLRACLRDSDTSARLGGDEFLIVARRAHADPLAVARRVLGGWSGFGGPTTLSAGVALHEAARTSQATFERADRALYKAKSAGKNRAYLWIEPVIEEAST